MTTEQPQPDPTPPPVEAPPVGLRVRSMLLVAGMAAGSVILWFGIPAFWVLVGAQISSPGTPTMAPIALVLLATPVSMVFFAPLLGRLDHSHRELQGSLREGPRRAAWNASMRDARTTTNDDGVLERVMIASVVIAAALAGIYFAFFGQLKLPS